jgi:hypothetical protein
MNKEDITVAIGLGVIVLGTWALIKMNYKKSDEEANIMAQDCLNAAKNKGVAESELNRFISDCMAAVSQEKA